MPKDGSDVLAQRLYDASDLDHVLSIINQHSETDSADLSPEATAQSVASIYKLHMVDLINRRFLVALFYKS